MLLIKFDADDLKRMIEERGLGVDYRVRVRIFTDSKENALTVPRSALFRDGGNWSCYAVRGGRATRVRAETVWRVSCV